MSLLSLYREFLADKDQIADYFLMDSQYLSNVAAVNGFYSGNFEDNVLGQAESIRNQEAPDNPEYFLRMMEAEAKWSSATFMWKETPLRYIMNIGPKLIERKIRKAEQTLTDKQVSELIEYCHPSDYPNVNARNNFGEGSSFGEAILHLDWIEYVAEPAEIELEERLIKETRRETFEYYFGERESLSEDVRTFQLSLWANDVA